MLKKRIIPCLDVKDGRVVKGINFVNLRDAGNPVEQAKFYNDSGADEICFLDIVATIENKQTIIFGLMVPFRSHSHVDVEMEILARYR